jgi:cell division septal protein FtsQ
MRANARRVTSFAEKRATALETAKALAIAALRTLGAAAVSAGLAWCAVQAHRWLTSDPRFTVSEISFEGLKRADAADLLARSGLRRGQNVFAADLAAAARGIGQHPWVASVRLERELPDRIVAHVREHEPAALVELGALYATDASGRLFKRVTRADALDLPLLTGLKRGDWTSARADAQARLSLALRLLDEWRDQGLPLSRLSEVRMDPDAGLTLFEQQPESLLEVRVGKSELSTRLRRLSQVRAALARRGERPVRIDLDLVKAGGGSWATAQVVTP